jgi:hypothetical protein
MKRNAAAVTLALVAAMACAAAAATPPPPGLVKLPNGDYTVPLTELQGSGVTGKATFHPVGMKTIVTVFAYGAKNQKHVFALHSGKDCSQLGVAGSRNLKPALTGEPSQTLVELPLSSIRSNYVVAAQDATKRANFQEACGHF